MSEWYRKAPQWRKAAVDNALFGAYAMDRKVCKGDGQMARKIAACAAALIVLALFAALLAAYTRPMEDSVYDLSLLPQTEAVPEGWVFDDKGWTVYTRDGGETRPLTPTGTGAYTGLTESGQTFYLSRVLDEALDAPTLQLGPSESSVAVFLDGELIYGDNVPRDAAVGGLRLPMLDAYRAEALSISLPADYLGKTLTIAQSTWAVEGVEPGEVMVFPLNVTLYCGYAYESGIISASFRTAIPAALAFAAASAPGMEKPWIRLDCHVKNDFFVFSCENSAAAERMKKEPADSHGLGKKIIERIMSRHGGLLRAEAGEDSYRVTLAIPLLSA